MPVWEYFQHCNELDRNKGALYAIQTPTFQNDFSMFFDSAFQVDVIVELQPLEDDVLLHRDAVLVLKCAKSVNWVVKAHGVRGKLVIVVRHKNMAHLNVCCYLFLTVGEGGDNILGRTVKFHSTSGTVITFWCQGITHRAWNIFHRRDNCLTSVIICQLAVVSATLLICELLGYMKEQNRHLSVTLP